MSADPDRMPDRSLIGRGFGGGAPFQARNPATGEALAPEFRSATPADLDRAADLAAAAATDYGRRSGQEKGVFLRAIAANLEAIAPQLAARAASETALPITRLQGETARACHQLRLFAALVEEGSWVEARLDRPEERAAGPHKPDLRSLLRPLGPVAVFGASNFPVAFSVAGGDTASALAAGCPVIAKAHPAHPGTSALAGAAIQTAAEACGMPEGVFSMLFDAGIEVGAALVVHPAIRAVGFTGSLTAGRRLMDLAAARPEPIPVFAEMGSLNPVFLLPEALAERGADIAAGLHNSVTLGAGQFCTKPGVVFAPAGAPAAACLERFAELMRATPALPLLTAGIAQGYQAGTTTRAARPGVRVLVQPTEATAPAVFEITAATWLADPALATEIFGPAVTIVHYEGQEDLLRLARSLSGQLTATLHATANDLRRDAALLPILEARVGRIVCNGFPTGVEVAPAMVHAGPYPATATGASSVGTRAITRFTRPVCYQNAPEPVLPPELLDANPLGIWRLLDGKWSREARSRQYRARGRAVKPHS